MAHAQFETIHPFADGNGRTGRALIHMILRRRGLGLRILPPVSLILATWAQDYIDGLMGTRYVDTLDSAVALSGINRWIALFASACRRAIEDASQFEKQVRMLQSSWREQVGRIRSDSTVQPSHKCAAQRSRTYSDHGIEACWKVIPGNQPGDRKARGCWRLSTGQCRQAQPGLRDS